MSDILLYAGAFAIALLVFVAFARLLDEMFPFENGRAVWSHSDSWRKNHKWWHIP